MVMILRDLPMLLLIGLLGGHCLGQEMHQDQLCKSTCTASWNMNTIQRHTYRYSTTITSSMKGPSSGSSQLAFDCVVDIDVHPGCPDMVLRLRNPQIKQSLVKRDNAVLRLKNIREALEKNPLWFLLRGGKVAALCPRRGEQVWVLNIKRAILSMLQTSHSGRARETRNETDIYGTCLTTYEHRGPSLVKTRHLQRCLRDRVEDFWWHSVPLNEDRTVSTSLECTQSPGTVVMERVNCTETVVLMLVSESQDLVQTGTVSTLTLLRSLEGIQVDSVSQQGEAYSAHLTFELEATNPTPRGGRSTQEVSHTVRRLCAQSADQRQQSELFLSLALLLRTLSIQQLKDAWQEVSFKCRDDWQPLLEALPACGSEACIHFTITLFLNNELDQDQIVSFLSTVTFVSRPTPSMIGHMSMLFKFPLIRPKTVLAVSSLVQRVCLKEKTPCSQIPEVREFMQVLQEDLGQACAGQGRTPVFETLHVLKAVENIGLVELVPELDACIRNRSAHTEVRLAAVQAFRRLSCHTKGTLAWAYQRLQEDVEIRIAAYQQLMRCPDQEVFRIVKDTLRNETSNQVGSFVWSHLVNAMKTEDPWKKDAMAFLPADIISKDFEAESWKYSSHVDHTMDSGPSIANVEGAVVFSPASFLPRSVMANVTVYTLGRSFNVLEAAFRMKNAERLLWRMLEGRHDSSKGAPSDRGQTAGQTREKKGQDCEPDISRLMETKFAGKEDRHEDLQCWINVKVFGNDLTFTTCAEVLQKLRALTLSVAGVTVELLKGQEVKLNHRAIVLAEELLLPSLSGLPVKLSLNTSSYYSLSLKGSPNFKNWSQFSLAGYIRPNAYVGVSARMGVDGAFGRAGIEWVTQVRTSTSLDGGVHLHNGQSLKMVLNTPEDVMDVLSLSSRMFRVSGESREELTASRNLKEKTTCSPKSWSKLFGWQLCSDVAYPVSLMGKGFPPPGPMLFSLRLQKLDRGLKKFLLEAAYAFVSQQNSWAPREANLLIYLGTPESAVPRDVSLDFSLTPNKLILKMNHPLKSLFFQGQLEERNGLHSWRAEVLVDDTYYYYVKALMETLSLSAEKRTHYQLEAKLTADGHPVVLLANVTHGLNGKVGVSARLRNVFVKDASFLVQLERRQEKNQRRYSVDASLLIPSLLSANILGLLEQRESEWSSGFRIRFGVQDDPKNMQECHVSQNVKDDAQLAETRYSLAAVHELRCSHIKLLNHKVQVRHERSPAHVQSSLDLSYGARWNQGGNKKRFLLSQSIRNQSGESVTSYALEFSLRVPDRGLNYRTQFLHSHQRRRKSEISTHLKVNYNDQVPLVAGLHWKDMSVKSSLQKWEGSANLDTPWLYVHVAHKFSELQQGAVWFTSEITTRKWVTVRDLVLDGLYRERDRVREAHVHVFTPTATYLKVGGSGTLGTRRINASCAIDTAWTPALKAELSLLNGKDLKTLEMNTSCGEQSLGVSAIISTVDKKLQKRLLTMSAALSGGNGPYLELDVGGRIEETRRDGDLYQKRWVLHFRQPFTFLPRSLRLQETFTLDLREERYVLESKVLLHENRKAIHVLTLGFRPQHPRVCSSLIHSFALVNVPPDSEMCISMHNKQTLRLRILSAKEEKLVVFGQVLDHGEDASQQGYVIKVNLTQVLQARLPSFTSLDADLRRRRTINGHEYAANGNVAVDGQDYDAYLTVQKSPAGNISSSLRLKSDGDIKVALGVSLGRSGARGVNVSLDLRQTLFPALTADAHLRFIASSSPGRFVILCALRKDEGTLLAQVNAASSDDPGFQFSLSGDLIISIPGFSSLPRASSLTGHLHQTSGAYISTGRLSVTLDHAVYAVGLSRDEKVGPERLQMCFSARDRSICAYVGGGFGGLEGRSFHAQVTHTFPWLLSAGLPFNSSAVMYVNQTTRGQSAEVDLQAGAQKLWLRLQRRVNISTGTAGHFVVNFTGGVGLDHILCRCYAETLDRSLGMELWANLTDSGHAVGENEGTSVIVEVLGHHLRSSSGLTVSVHHDVPILQPYVPLVFHTKSQLNRSSSSVQAVVEVTLGGERMRGEAQLARTKLGWKQSLELGHSFQQMKSVPSGLWVKTVYHQNNGSRVHVAHQTQWRDDEPAGPASPQQRKPRRAGTESCGWRMEMRLENEIWTKMADVLAEWTLRGKRRQMRASSSWSSLSGRTEATLELKQPLTSTLSHVRVEALSHTGNHSNTQVQVSWDGGAPTNVSVTVRGNSSRWQACVLLSPGQMRSVFALPLLDAHGCFSVAQEGKLTHRQGAELRWGSKRITQNIRYQRSEGGMHTVQIKAAAQNVSPAPCPSHTVQAQIQTNLRDTLEHHVVLGLCPPHPALSWSGTHRVNSGKDLLHSHTGVSVSGQNQHSAFVLAVRNASSVQSRRYSLLAEWKLGNWSVELGGSSHSSGKNSTLRVQAKLDRSEAIWLQGSLGKRCLQAAAGHSGDSSDDLRATFCLERRRRLMFEARRGGGDMADETLAVISAGAGDGGLAFHAKGCRECLTASEARLQQLVLQVKRKLLERLQKLTHLLLELRRQARGSSAVQELNDASLRITRGLENLLMPKAPALWDAWTSGVARRTLTSGLPQTLQVLQRTSQLVQQELRKPLATLAGAYHDVTGERLDRTWDQTRELWGRELVNLLPVVLHNQHLRAPFRSALQGAVTMLDLVLQQTVQWTESRLATTLVGVRRQLAVMFKFSKEDGELSLSLPLPRNPWVRRSEVGVATQVVEEFLVKPLLSLSAASVAAELYRLKRRLMDSPFDHRAFLLADSLAVSFDGRVSELPPSRDLVLAVDAAGSAFGIVLGSGGEGSPRSLVVRLQNSTIRIRPGEQVEVDCTAVDLPFGNPSAIITQEPNLLTVSNGRGLTVSCDPDLSLCSVTLEGWLHGISRGILGTNDNEAGNDFMVHGEENFTSEWKEPGTCRNRTVPPPACSLFFSSGSSPLSSCFRVVDPEQFLAVCERSRCDPGDVPRSPPCGLALAYVQLCRRNYVPLELPIQCD